MLTEKTLTFIKRKEKVAERFGVNANRCYVVAGHASNSSQILPFFLVTGTDYA